MPTKFYSKELANNLFYLPDGKTPVNFEVFPSNVGVIALDVEKNAEIIAALDDAASKRRGGIVPIDEATYNDLKKNRGGSRTSAAYQPTQRLQAMRSPTVFRPPAQVPQPASPANPAATNGNHVAPPAPTAGSQTPNLDAAPKATKRPKTSRKSEAESKVKTTSESPPKT